MESRSAPKFQPIRDHRDLAMSLMSSSIDVQNSGAPPRRILNYHLSASHLPSQILTNNLLLDNIFGYTTPGTLANLFKTCTYVHDAVQEYISKVYNINKALRRYFDDPYSFRSMQAKTRTLISGSFVLQFLARTYYPRSDLDLYCSFDVRKEVGTWIMKQGYIFHPHSSQDPSFSEAVEHGIDPIQIGDYEYLEDICGIYTFRKPGIYSPHDERKVQVIVACDNPMKVIFDFHSTCVMNIIAYDCAYSLYPRATFEEHISLYNDTNRRMGRDIAALGKYNARGFKILHDWPAKTYDERIIPTFPRWMGDHHTWRISLSLEGITPPLPLNPISQALPTDPCYFTTWHLRSCYSSRWVQVSNERRYKEIRTPEPGVRTYCNLWGTDGLALSYVLTNDQEVSECLKGKVREVCRSKLGSREVDKWNRDMWEPVLDITVNGEPLKFVDAELLRWCKETLSARGKDAWNDEEEGKSLRSLK